MTKPVFVSYSTDDTAVAEQIRDGLEAAGIPCWMAPRDIAPGLDYGTQIIDAIEACTALVLVLSESSNYSIYVRKEVERAIAKGKVVIPVRIQEVAVSRSLEFFISDAQWIDAWDALLAQAIGTLQGAVEGHLRRGAEGGSAAPAAPRRPSQVADTLPSATHSPSATHQPPPVERVLFVGREDQMAELESALAQSLAGQGQLRFVTGEAGAGKSALLNEFQFLAREQDSHLLIVSGACDAQTGTSDPYLPFREILTALAREDAGRAALLEQGPDLIDTLVPGMALGSHRSGPGRATDAKPVDQSQVIEQAVQVLQAIAQSTPLVLILEDLHWVDDASNGLLFRLGRQLEGSRILLLGTYRSEEVSLGRGGEVHPLQKIVDELRRILGAIHIDLDQARVSEGRDLIDDLLDTEPNQLDERFRQAFYEQTGGHPLFVVELLQDLQNSEGLVRDADGRWIVGETLNWTELPDRVEGIIAVRMARLNDEQRQLLDTASVSGEQFIAEAVALALNIDHRQVALQLSNELQKQHRLVQIVGRERIGRQRLTRFRFSHNLMQTYLYEELGEVERDYLHEDLGNALEELVGEDTDSVVVQLARHFQQADIPEKAVTYLIRAGTKAVALSAYAEASDYFGQALILLDELPPGEEKDRQDFTVHFNIGKIEEAVQGIGSGDSEAAFTRALALARQLDDPRLTIQPLLPLAWYAWFRSDMDLARHYGEESSKLAREIQDPESLMLASQPLSLCATGLGEHDKAITYGDAVIDYYGDDYANLSSGEVVNLALFCGMRGTSLVATGYPDRALELTRKSLSVAQEHEDLYAMVTACGMLSNIYMQRGEWEAALQFAEEQRSRSEAGNMFLNRIYGETHVGVATAMLGAVDRGVSMVRKCFRDREALGISNGQIAYFGFLAAAYGQTGRVAEGLDIINEGLVVMEATDDRQLEAKMHHTKGDLLLMQDLSPAERPSAEQEAEECFRKAIQVARAGGARLWAARAMASLCRLLESQGRVEEWQKQIGKLRELYAWFSEGFETEDLRVVKEVLDASGETES